MKIKKLEDVELVVEFFCPGCQEIHTVHVGKKNASGASWSFNNDYVKPTFSPSIHIRTGNYAIPNSVGPEDSWLNTICHSFVRDGRIQFLTDCTHKLAGQEVDLPDF